NAFYGPARNQVRDLVKIFENANAESLFGFSNRRMAFDDVISKALCAFEEANIAGKITASDVSDKYRSLEGFSRFSLERASAAIEKFCAAASYSPISLKLNKATLFSWIIFTSTLQHSSSDKIAPALASYIPSF